MGGALHIRRRYRRSRHSTLTKHQDKVHKVKSQQKPNKVAKNNQNGHSSTSKPKAKKSHVVGDTATVLAGAALAHQMLHHKHDDARDIADDFRDPYDADLDDLYDMDIDDVTYDNSDYDSYRAAYEEEQAAYDDFIASMDMDD